MRISWMALVSAGVAVSCAGAALAQPQAATPWADRVIKYEPGTDPAPGYSNPATALGEPTRFTGVGSFPGVVTPFNPAFGANEIVSLGRGGELVLGFDEPVTDDPANPFGIDVLIFGNAGYIDRAFPSGVVGGVFGAGQALIEVSADGSNWKPVPGMTADSPFPTLGYSDLTDPYATSPGAIPTDFTRPVDPTFIAADKTFAQLRSAYAGSGGGLGIDLAATGLSSISFVRFLSPSGATATTEIDAAVDVAPIPAPAGVISLALAGAFSVARCRRQRRPLTPLPETDPPRLAGEERS